jgi:DNA ligase-1
MYYSDLAHVYFELEKTTKRLEKTEIISEFIKKVPKNDIKKVIYLLQGKIYASWEEDKLGVSERLIIKIISQSSGVDFQEIEKLWKKHGDLGKVAEEVLSNKKQFTLSSKKLTLEKVFENLRKLSSFEGSGTVNKKVSLVVELLNNASPLEARYIINTIVKGLRVGVAAGVARDSIAKAFNKDVKEVEDVYNITTDYGETAELAAENKLSGVLKPGRPIKLQLAIKVDDIKEALNAVGSPAQFEYKLDGFRVQIHSDGKEIKLFTRRMENVTEQFPDVVKVIKEHVKGKSFILDSEVVGHKNEKYLAFQNISQRIKRKYDIEKIAKEYPVEIDVFDVVYHDGKNYMKIPLNKRRKLLEKIIKEKVGDIILTKKLISDDEKKIKEFYSQALQKGTEGLIAKKIDGDYKPGRYVNGWIKLKPVMESLDLVITGAIWGEGKRSDWLSSFILSCRKGDKFLEIGRVGTGIKEKNEGVTFSDLTKELKKIITKDYGKNVEVKPKIIVSVNYEEIQKSPTYSSSYALRFPRVITIRDDLGLNDVDDLKRITRIYEKQRYRK